MKLTGEFRVAAPQEKVWAALNDPEVLKACIPGCGELEKTSDTEFTATVQQKIGPVSAKFTGNIELKDIDAPNGYRIEGSGSGGAAGGASGGADIRLTADGDGTMLEYDADARVTGKIAQLGQRMIDPVARKLAAKFFDNFNAHFAGGEEHAGTVGETATGVAAAAAAIAGGDAGMASGYVDSVRAAASEALHDAKDKVSDLAHSAGETVTNEAMGPRGAVWIILLMILAAIIGSTLIALQ